MFEDGYPRSGIAADNAGMEDDARLGLAGNSAEVEPRQHVVDRTRCRDLAVGEEDESIGDPGDLVEGVADIDDRQPHLVAEALDIGEDLVLPRFVERGKRLVHEEEAGACEQRPADRHPLLLAAGKARRTPGEEGGDAEEVDHLVERAPAVPPRGQAAPVEKVRAHREVREEATFLEDIADPAAVCRHIDPPLVVEQHDVVDRDHPAVRPEEAGDQVDEGGLARPRSPEKRGHQPRTREGDVEGEFADRLPDIDAEGHAPTSLRARRRDRASDTRSAAKAIAIAIAVRRRAGPSPPGTCV